MNMESHHSKEHQGYFHVIYGMDIISREHRVFALDRPPAAALQLCWDPSQEGSLTLLDQQAFTSPSALAKWSSHCL